MIECYTFFRYFHIVSIVFLICLDLEHFSISMYASFIYLFMFLFNESINILSSVHFSYNLTFLFIMIVYIEFASQTFDYFINLFTPMFMILSFQRPFVKHSQTITLSHKKNDNLILLFRILQKFSARLFFTMTFESLISRSAFLDGFFFYFIFCPR